MARYVIRATNDTGVVEFTDRLTIDASLEKAKELGEVHFRHITIINVLTGIEISDVEALIQKQAGPGSPSGDTRLHSCSREAHWQLEPLEVGDR